MFGAIKSSLFLLVFTSVSTLAVTWPLTNLNSRIVGENITISIPIDNKHPLEYFASKYNIGLSNILEANPNVDIFLPEPGSKIVIPYKTILPDAPHQGIVINSAEMRLYYYPDDSNTVVVLPIGIGVINGATPEQWTTKVIYKKEGPSWTPTAHERSDYAKDGISLPTVIPPGPNNPMGLYALYVGNLYAIHGTNASFGIGLRSSHGCVRLRNDDISYLFHEVPTGTRVQFVNQPIKMSREPDGKLWLEVHEPLSHTYSELESNEKVMLPTLPQLEREIRASDIKEIKLIDNLLKKRDGYPREISAGY